MSDFLNLKNTDSTANVWNQTTMYYDTSTASTPSGSKPKPEPEGPLDWLDDRIEEMRSQGREALTL